MNRQKLFRFGLVFLICFASGCGTVSDSMRQTAVLSGEKSLYSSAYSAQSAVSGNSAEVVNYANKAKYSLARHFQKLGKHRIAIEILKEIVNTDSEAVADEKGNVHRIAAVSRDLNFIFKLSPFFGISNIDGRILSSYSFSLNYSLEDLNQIKNLKSSMVMRDLSFHRRKSFQYGGSYESDLIR